MRSHQNENRKHRQIRTWGDGLGEMQIWKKYYRLFKIPESRQLKSNKSKNMKVETFLSIEKTWKVNQHKCDSPRPLTWKAWSQNLCQEDRWNSSSFCSFLKYAEPLQTVPLNYKRHIILQSLNARAITCITTMYRWHKSAEKYPRLLKTLLADWTKKTVQGSHTMLKSCLPSKVIEKALKAPP